MSSFRTIVCLYSDGPVRAYTLGPETGTSNCKGVQEVSLFLQVYGGCGIATLIGFLALCQSSASRARHAQPHRPGQVTGEQSIPH